MAPAEDSPSGASLLARWSETEPEITTLGPAAQPPTPAPGGNRRALRRRRRRRRRILIAVATALVLVVGAGAGYAEYLNHEIRRLSVGGLSGSEADGSVNILLVGSTSRCALTHQNAAFGLCSQGVTGVNSDVVMILHLDPAHSKVSILSIPRDLFVPNARTTGANKIDAALYEGPTQLVHAIESDFGIPIQHYVELNFDTFQGVVNALGGIKLYFPMPLYDAESDLNIPAAGCQTLNGFQALAVVRARHLQYKPPSVTTSYHAYWPQDPESDLSRIRRDHEFLRVLAAQVAARGLGNPVTDQALVSAVAPDLQVDSGLSLTDMINLVLTFHSVNPDSAPQATLPVYVNPGLTYYYSGYNYGSVELTSEPQDTQAIYQFLGMRPGHDTMTGAALPSPSSITVSVENGSGISDQATLTAEALRALGFAATPAGDVSVRARPSETLVTYDPKVHGALGKAEAVLTQLSGPAILSTSTTASGADVTVVTGTDLAVNQPAGTLPTTTSTVASGSRSTTTTSPSSGSGTGSGASLGTPTPATEALAPFDPRSCSAKGGPGP